MTDKETREHNRISRLGMVVLVMAMVSLMVVLWTSYADRQATECQKDLNARFLAVLKERASIADGDRAAIRELVDGLVGTESETERAKALAKYKAANKALDEAREKVEFPQDTELCN